LTIGRLSPYYVVMSFDYEFMDIKYWWQDFGESADDWNKEFPRKMISLFSEKGFGI